jgi:hypothetical protein
MKNKNIIPVLRMIQNLDESSLKNPVVVADLVRCFGLVCWGPPAFGGDEQYKNPTSDMAGIYQTPIQIAGALAFLSEFKIESYLEIGVFQGGNFLFVTEYLRRFNPEIKCLGIDPTGFLNPDVKELTELSEWRRIAQVTSDKLGDRKFDCVFIDGDHSAEWVRADYQNAGRRAKVCLIHDIQEPDCPAVVEFWNDLKRTSKKERVEFTDSETENKIQGIGILFDKKEPKT